MARRKSPPEPQGPLPIPTTQLARGLIRLHARLRGELLKHAERREVLVEPVAAQEAVEHIEGVLRFLNVRFDPRAIQPRRTWPKIGPLQHGDLQAEILAALRRHEDWMTYVQVADAIVEKHALKLDAERYEHFLQKLREAMHLLLHRSVVERELPLVKGLTKCLQRWRLAPMLRR